MNNGAVNNDLVIADAGPLIALARIGQFQLFHDLYDEIWIPPAVLSELRLDTQRPGVAFLQQALTAGWLRVAAVRGRGGELASLKRLLDAGEAEAMLLAEQMNARFLIIDDRKGRMIARRRGIPVVGLAGVLLAAKTRGLLPQVGPALAALAVQGYRLSNNLIMKIIQLAGESAE